MEPYEPHLALVTAIGVGLLIGLEREQAKPTTDGASFAGIRTYPLFALVGALATMLASALPWIPLVALAGLIVLVGIAYAGDVRKGNDQGVTTEISAVATFLLGALAASHGVIEPLETRLLLVVGLGVAITFLLSSKNYLHGFASRVSKEDVYSTLKFLIAATIVLPLLPHEPVGPLDAINPFSVGLMVVLISAISFAGYVAMRLLGQGRGLIVSAAVGGLVSSTAVTISFANRTKSNPELAAAAAGAIAIASTIMIVRVGVLVAITNPTLLAESAIPLAGSLLGALVGGLLVYRRHPEAQSDEELKVTNPFDLGNAVRFGIVFAAIVFATKAAKTYLGNQGLYLTALIAGATDVDAITLSTARQVPEHDAATIAILIAIASNTLVKSSIAAWIGGRSLGSRAFVYGAFVIAGAFLGGMTSVLLS